MGFICFKELFGPLLWSAYSKLPTTVQKMSEQYILQAVFSPQRLKGRQVLMMLAFQFTLSEWSRNSLATANPI
ncbi:uncharacterized protein ARMOST_08513 [Armillaria ostoyae]|uniref:Uncharacterized protein n=1 Tax=Armillaria ostoyae TaxID=47428 RepID=A0A284R8U1_ARMOS|nr:uncharacterized protein ARMOST_08513 [Armillaria ostoyae]